MQKQAGRNKEAWRSGNGSKIRVTGVTKGGSRVILLEI